MGFTERRAVTLGTVLRGFVLGPPEWDLKEGQLAGQSGGRCTGAVETDRCICVYYLLIYLFKQSFYLLLERGREGEREGEKHRSVAPCTPPTGDLAGNPGMCPD